MSFHTNSCLKVVNTNNYAQVHIVNDRCHMLKEEEVLKQIFFFVIRVLASLNFFFFSVEEKEKLIGFIFAVGQ